MIELGLNIDGINHSDVIRLLEQNLRISTQIPHTWIAMGETAVVRYREGAFFASSQVQGGTPFTIIPRPLGAFDPAALWELYFNVPLSDVLYLEAWEKEDSDEAIAEFKEWGYSLVKTYPLTYLHQNLKDFDDSLSGGDYRKFRKAQNNYDRSGMVIRPLLENDLEQMISLFEGWLFHKISVGQITNPLKEITEDYLATIMALLNLDRSQALSKIRSVWMRNQEHYQNVVKAFSMGLDPDHYELNGIFSPDGKLLATRGYFKFGETVNPFVDYSPPNDFSPYAGRALALDAVGRLKTEGRKILLAGCKESQKDSLLEYKATFGELHEFTGHMHVLRR